MRPWWEREPERLDAELSALDAAGFDHELDLVARARGRVRLRLRDRTSGLELVAAYPDLFPFFRPYVYAPGLALSRHQNPITHELCLLGHRSDAWVDCETLADVLKTQLPPLLAYSRSGDLAPLLQVEERLGEPASAYYAPADEGAYLLIDSGWTLPKAVRRGRFTALCQASQAEREPLRGFVAEVFDEHGTVLATWTGPRPRAHTKHVRGAWVRRDAAPLAADTRPFYEQLTPEELAFFEGAQKWPTSPHRRIEAVIFPEEVGQQAFADGWIGLEWRVPGRNHRKPVLTGQFVRIARAGETDLAARMPATGGLRDKTVAVFGTGAIGAPAALELARAGVGRLVLVDPDHMDPATARRWPIGWSAFGAPKVAALQALIERDYPWTAVTPSETAIGAITGAADQPLQHELVETLLDGVDLILDATAELGVNHFLSGLAQIRSIPYVLINATPGAQGGMVASFNMRADEACWMCLRHALYATNSLPLPPADETGELQAAGCGQHTFTGAAFDLQEISLEAVRVIAGRLAADSGYPATGWQLGVLSLRDADGARIPPSWTGLAVPRRDGCACAGR